VTLTTDKTPETGGTPGAAVVADGKLVSTSPATGAEIGRFPVHGQEDVAAAVERAREAAAWWRDLGWRGRRESLLRWKRLIAARMTELVELIHAENGKPVADGLLEVVLTLDHLHWATTHARSVLGERRVRSGLLGANQNAWKSYEPYGVIGVIGPWNYPVFTPAGSVAYALAAGNAVVFKPSEYTPATGSWLADTFAEAVPGPPVFQVVTGLGETGSALCQAGVDKVAFTGSTATGKKVMAACAETLTPVLVECGGKDAVIVDTDADLDAAVDGVLFGAAGNAGQTCAGVERVYVVGDVYDDFVDKLTEKASRIRAGAEPEADLGPITMPGQREVIRRHIDGALAAGGRALVGGADSVRAPYVDPVVLVDVPEDAEAVTDETFGPTLTVAKVRDADEAVAKANTSRYGLGAAVFGRRRAREIAARLHCGMVALNGVISYAAVPSLPFGGVGDSGFGRIHGEDGLREFTRVKSVAGTRFPLLLPIMELSPRRLKGMTLLGKVARRRHGGMRRG
jgi:succinate-semialdehyde dehydrogenase/glutarate-semialdehyde dehydrogenase